MKKIIVTAPTSTVASAFIKYASDNYSITTVGRRKSQIYFDFASDKELTLPQHADAIIHFASVLYARTDEEILDMINTNVRGLVRLCIAAKQNGIKQLVYISSISTKLKEDSEYYGFYSLTKRHAEETARLYCKKNQIKLCIIRPSQIFGNEEGYARHQSLLYMMIRNAAENKPIFIYGTHDALRNYIYVDNLLRIISKAIDLCSDEDIDVLDPRNYTLSEAAAIIINKFHSKSEIIFMKNRPDISDNPFYGSDNYFEKWGIEFTDFDRGVEMIRRAMISD